MAKTNEPKKLQSKPINRYVLEKYNGVRSRHTCPNCGYKHSYTKFVDITTGEYVGDQFGRCDRVEKCGYFNPPTGDDAKGKSLMVKPKEALDIYQEDLSGISLINSSKALESITFNDLFSKFLFKNFDAEKVKTSLLQYKVGESNKWKGATVFWQIDQDYDLRTGKIILYDENTGKRVKNPKPCISWEHVPDYHLLDKSYIDFNLKQCVFGEHLVTPETTEVHIVESEKTAILCSLIDNKIWLAVGGIEMINEERLLPFKHCNITFYPDKGEKAYTKWKNKLTDISETFNIKLSNYINKTDLQDGEDLADLIISKYAKSNK